MKKIGITLIWIALILAFSCNGKDHSEWVWDIDGDKYTQNDLNAAYEGYLFMMKEQLQQATRSAMTDKEFLKYVKDPESIENPQLRAMFAQLDKKVFLDQYQTILLMKKEAEKSGYLERKDVKNKLEFMHNYFLSNLYLMDKIKPQDISVSDDEALSLWDKIRKSDRRYAAVPILEGQRIAKQRILMQKMMEKNSQVNKNIRDKYKIETNEAALETMVNSKKDEGKASDKNTNSEEESSESSENK